MLSPSREFVGKENRLASRSHDTGQTAAGRPRGGNIRLRKGGESAVRQPCQRAGDTALYGVSQGRPDLLRNTERTVAKRKHQHIGC